MCVVSVWCVVKNCVGLFLMFVNVSVLCCEMSVCSVFVVCCVVCFGVFVSVFVIVCMLVWLLCVIV